uniref:Clock-associated PAS protein ZTL n=1 Tax=Tetraselmis sp. GSL018 TaxID=582737 RepID=A0A061S0T0_9CHLO
MFGGESLTGEALNDTYILDLSAENPCWQVLNVLKRPSARWGHTLRWLRNSWVILFGGYGPEGPLNDVHILDLEAEAKVWERVQTPSSPSPRSWHSSCMVHGSQMVVFGGKDEAGGLLNDTVVLDLRDPESACWREVDTIWRPPGVLGHSLCTTTDSKIFMFGGLQSNGSIRLRTNDVFLLDLEAVKPSWQYLSGSTLPAGRCLSGQGPSPRLEPVTGSLIGGQVLVFGGSTETGDAPCNEVYAVDPESKSPRWQRMDVSGDAPGKGWGFSACTVGNHKVVLPCGTPSGEMLLHEFRELSIVSSATPDGRQGRRAGRASATRLPSMGSSSRNPQENRAPWTHSWCPEPHQPGAAGSPAISSGVTTQLDDSTGRQDPPPAGSNEGVLAGTAPETSGSGEDTVTSPAADGEASTSGAAKD